MQEFTVIGIGVGSDIGDDTLVAAGDTIEEGAIFEVEGDALLARVSEYLVDHRAVSTLSDKQALDGMFGF